MSKSLAMGASDVSAPGASEMPPALPDTVAELEQNLRGARLSEFSSGGASIRLVDQIGSDWSAMSGFVQTCKRQLRHARCTSDGESSLFT